MYRHFINKKGKQLERVSQKENLPISQQVINEAPNIIMETIVLLYKTPVTI